MKILDKIENWALRRKLIKDRIVINDRDSIGEKEFKKVLNTLRENKIMTTKLKDGIYIRFAGNESYGELNSKDWVKVVDFRDLKLKNLGI